LTRKSGSEGSASLSGAILIAEDQVYETREGVFDPELVVTWG
jgi:hypothetical protein